MFLHIPFTPVDAIYSIYAKKTIRRRFLNSSNVLPLKKPMVIIYSNFASRMAFAIYCVASKDIHEG